MVMMSFKVIEVRMPVPDQRIKDVLATLKEEFGDGFVISFRDGEVVVEGDDLRDYRVHDRVLDILEGN